MEPLRLRPDDEIGRFAAVWLGPPGYTLPFQARYSAYVLGGLIFILICAVEWLLPARVGVPPVWELCETFLATSLIMLAVDYDKPITAVVANIWTVYTTRRATPNRTTTAIPRMVDLKITRDPLE